MPQVRSERVAVLIKWGRQRPTDPLLCKGSAAAAATRQVMERHRGGRSGVRWQEIARHSRSNLAGKPSRV